MNKKRALSLAREWAQGHRCTIRDGEASEYHAMFASMLEKSTPNELLTLEQLLDMNNVPIWVIDTYQETADLARIVFEDLMREDARMRGPQKED